MIDCIPADQTDIVEVVAREHADALWQPLTNGDLRLRIEQTHLDASYFVGVFGNDLQEDFSCGLPIWCSEVPLQFRIERGPEPVQHDRHIRTAQHLPVDTKVVCTVGRCTGEVAR